MDVITAPPGPPGGETVPVGCPEPLAAAIVLRLEDEGRRTAEGRAGRARVERSHSLDVWLPAIADLTRSVVDGSRGAERTPPAAGGR